MGLNIDRPASLWKDRAMVEVNVAVLHSYQVGRKKVYPNMTIV